MSIADSGNSPVFIPHCHVVYKGTHSPLAAIASNKYAFRNPDGSNYVQPRFSGLGKANSSYAHSVPHRQVSRAILPDAGLIFDTLLCRSEFIPHPGGINSLFFAFANLLVHTIFRTDHTDPFFNSTSSYLDLSILYGDSEKTLGDVRLKDGRGRLHEDVFADVRLLLMPPSTCALLVLLCRNHNFTAQRILQVNELGTYRSRVEDDAKRLAQDDEIFNRARLVNCGYFMRIVLGDYVGAILGLVRDGSSWRLDPVSASPDATDLSSPRGEGSVSSIEFDLMYRWHATLSEQETRLTEELFNTLFDDPTTVRTATGMFTIARPFIPACPSEPRTRSQEMDFSWLRLPRRLTRGTDGRFKDSDLARVLQDATSWRAGAYKARGTPQVLRVVEIMGIQRARLWGACSLNDFRRSLGLKPYSSFQEWNPDVRVHTAAAELYEHIDNLELYVGLQAEEAKRPEAGVGLCSGFTTSRCILADVVSLTRGDRFLTFEFTPFNLTSWGYLDCQPETQDGSYGGMLTKLLFRTLPGYYVPRSAYAHFPFLDPAYMREFISHNNPNVLDKYIWTRPTPPAESGDLLVVKTIAGIRTILDERDAFPPGYSDRLNAVTAHKYVNSTLVNKLLLQHTAQWAIYFGQETSVLIHKRSRGHIGQRRGMSVDVVRDVINVLPVRWICNRIAGLPLRDDPEDEHRQCTMFADVCQYIFLNPEPSRDWGLRESSGQTFRHFQDVLTAHLGSLHGVSPTSPSLLNLTAVAKLRALDPYRTSLAKSLPFLERLSSQESDLTVLVPSLFFEVVSTARQWSHVIANVVNFYLDASRTHVQKEIVRLAGRQTREANEQVLGYIRAALGGSSAVVWGVYRTAQRTETDIFVDSAKIPVGQRVFASIKEANAGPCLYWSFLASHFGLAGERTAPQVLAHIFGLKGLKRASGPSGRFRKFVETVDGAAQQWYMDARSNIMPWPESLVIEVGLRKSSSEVSWC
ncbi:heme peroxidase [Mycena leptocephala]|nr:heme peroxidase [Mycena leptocephala]